MKSHRVIVLVAGVAFLSLVTGLAFRPSLEAEEKKPPADRENPFAGKIIVFYAKGETSATDSAALENPAFLEFKGQRFLTGKRVDKEGGPWNGVKTFLAFDNVSAIYEFDDIKAFREFEEKVAEEAEEANRALGEMVLPLGIPGGLPRQPIPTDEE